jgi:hypothetical protein
MCLYSLLKLFLFSSDSLFMSGLPSQTAMLKKQVLNIFHPSPALPHLSSQQEKEELKQQLIKVERSCHNYKAQQNETEVAPLTGWWWGGTKVQMDMQTRRESQTKKARSLSDIRFPFSPPPSACMSACLAYLPLILSPFLPSLHNRRVWANFL